jgi:hypothetical protein
MIENLPTSIPEVLMLLHVLTMNIVTILQTDHGAEHAFDGNGHHCYFIRKTELVKYWHLRAMAANVDQDK